MQAPFNKNDPKYHYLCCCGAHVSTIARVLIILDFIPLLLSGMFFYILLGIAYGVGVYGVFKQSRAPLLIYTILGMIISLISVAMHAALIVLVDVDKLTKNATAAVRESHKESFSLDDVRNALFALFALSFASLLIKAVFSYFYWKLAQFIKDQKSAQPAQQYAYHVRP